MLSDEEFKEMDIDFSHLTLVEEEITQDSSFRYNDTEEINRKLTEHDDDKPPAFDFRDTKITYNKYRSGVVDIFRGKFIKDLSWIERMQVVMGRMYTNQIQRDYLGAPLEEYYVTYEKMVYLKRLSNLSDYDLKPGKVEEQRYILALLDKKCKKCIIDLMDRTLEISMELECILEDIRYNGKYLLADINDMNDEISSYRNFYSGREKSEREQDLEKYGAI